MGNSHKHESYQNSEAILGMYDIFDKGEGAWISEVRVNDL